MLEQILTGIISNTLFVLLWIAFGIVIYRLVGRRSLLRFFGISGDRRLRIYIGQLTIIPRDSAARDAIQRMFHGSTVGFLESIEARRIAELFLFLIPGLSGLPNFLSRIFLADVTVDIEPAAFAPAEPLLDCSYISLGTPAFNTSSAFIEEKVRNDLGFRDNNSQLLIPGLQPILRETDEWQGVIARLTYSGIRIFYLAGFNDFGTAGAAYYLRRNWRALHSRFGNSDFYVLITVPTADYSSVRVIAENSL